MRLWRLYSKLLIRIFSFLLCLLNRKYIDRYEEISLLSASEMIFRHCMSIAESFIQNWLYFPVSLQKENCNEIAVLLSQTTQLNSTQFSFSLLEELLLDYQCIKQVLIEIMRFVRITKEILMNRNPRLDILAPISLHSLYLFIHILVSLSLLM